MGVDSLTGPSAKVQLGGRERTLRLDLNTLAEIEEATGCNPFTDQEAIDESSPKGLRLLVWACLYEEVPRPTQQEVGAWLLADWQGVMVALVDLRGKVFPVKNGAPQRPPKAHRRR